jgi:uncharacterized membrane protein YfcA
MAAGSITGTLIGGLLLGHVSSAVLVPILALLPLLSAYKVWRHYPSQFSDGLTLRWLVASRQGWDDK